MKQWYCVVNGRQYGPISEEELRRWVAEGRLRPTDRVWSGGMAEWKCLLLVPGLLRGPGTPPGILKAHRGTAVLTLGIIGCWPCMGLACAIIAIVMARKDLPEMAAGQMDPAGLGMTQAGKICGIVGVCISSAMLAFYLVYFVVIIVVIGAAAVSGH